MVSKQSVAARDQKTQKFDERLAESEGYFRSAIIGYRVLTTYVYYNNSITTTTQMDKNTIILP